MSEIEVKNLTFGYPDGFEKVFENASFRLDTNWRLGLVGRNGKGKTTLLKLLRGEYEFDGTIFSDAEFFYFPFQTDGLGESGMEILRGLCPEAADWEIVREINLIGLDVRIAGRSFSALSEGERTRLMLVALFLKRDGFALIDEPTNHLDMASRQALAEYLCKKKGFILVSHDRSLLDGCVDHIMSLNRAGIEIRKGNFSEWERDKEERDKSETERNSRLKKDIERLKDAAGQAARWSDKTESSKKGKNAGGLKPDRGYVGHKAAKMMKRSKVIEQRYLKAAEEKSSLLKNVEENESLKIFTQDFPKRMLAEFKDCSLFYGERKICGPLNFAVERGDRIALCGKNGSGKSSVLKLLCGQEIGYTGSVYVAQGLKISYLPQNTDLLKGSLRDFAAKRGADESLFKAVLRKLGFERLDFDKDISDFSAGQKKKTALAVCLCETAHLLVLDEPLNYVDVLSRIQIERAILDCQPTVIFVEHDKAFADNVATKRIFLD